MRAGLEFLITYTIIVYRTNLTGNNLVATAFALSTYVGLVCGNNKRPPSRSPT